MAQLPGLLIMKELNKIIKSLSSRFIEREEEIKGIMLSLMTKEHCLFIGPPGTAKSALVEVAATLSGLSYFRALVSKFTTPDELFGPPDISELEKGIYKRNISGMLPEAEVVFLDEVFKASPSILNTLLSIMQERIYKNGTTYKTPTISMFGASNEVPEGEDDAALSAFSDRFLLRYEVRPVSDHNNFLRLLKDIEPTEKLLTEVRDKNYWLDIFAAVDAVVVDAEIYTSLLDIKTKLEEDENSPFISDRRWKKCIKILKANAALRNAEKVDIDDDFEILIHALWDPGFPDSRQAVEKAVRSVANPISLRLQELLEAAKETAQTALNATAEEEAAQGLEAVKGLKRIMAEIDKISANTSRREAKVKALKTQIAQLQKEVSAKCLGIAL